MHKHDSIMGTVKKCCENERLAYKKEKITWKERNRYGDVVKTVEEERVCTQ